MRVQVQGTNRNEKHATDAKAFSRTCMRTQGAVARFDGVDYRGHTGKTTDRQEESCRRQGQALAILSACLAGGSGSDGPGEAQKTQTHSALR